MKLFEFDKYFPNEEVCKTRFKEIRDKQGVICPRCKSTKQYWKTSKEMYQCAKCGCRQSLKSHTVMHGSKLPFRYWFIAMHLLTATKQSFSAAEIQRQLNHNRYQPIWELMHKLRSVMGKRDNEYTLHGVVEMDTGFFTTETPEELKGKKLKAGAGSERKAKVAVMAETKESIAPKKGQKPTKVKYIKMIMVEDLKAATIGKVVGDSVVEDSIVVTDASTSHVHFKNMFREHKSQVIKPEDIGKVLPWVHIAISNSKSLMHSIHHGVSPEYLQSYLNEFCYKFNRRYFGDGLFDRLVSVGVSYKSNFVHKTYRDVA